jgi:aspartyl-tRNA(Asn)/glutamyl-tRNA(Gln) amidotransferase subunit A
VTAPSPATIAGVPVDARAASVYTTVANLAGLFGLALPAPVAADALPVGMQLVGPAGREALAFDVARELRDAAAVAAGEPVRASGADAP